jgi:acyl-coenzyme A synthetase/AMP-(fatty) acid ligase
LELVVREKVTSLLTLPSYVRVLYDSTGNMPAFARIERLILAGERVVGSDVTDAVKRSPAIHIFNEYGPTEATVWASAMRLSPGAEWEAGVPIGTAVAHVKTYILDEDCQQVAVGHEGELHIGGESIAAGYINNPRETADRFIPDPFSDRPGSRLYRTGDRVVMGADANLMFVGRVDRQIKLHGYRIELDHIEVAATNLPDVSAAAAIYLASPEDRVEQSEIRTRLQSALPRHMLPARIRVVTDLQRLPNGKFDYEALTRAARGTQDIDVEMHMVDGLHARIRGIWETVLQRTEISLDEDFFDLGGNSIKAAMIANRVQRLLKTKLYVGQLFEQPTIRGLCAYLTGSCPMSVQDLEQG